MAMQMLTQDDDGYAVTQRRPRTRPPSFSGSQVDLRNSRSMNNLNRVSYQPSMVHSVFPHVEEHLIPPASSEHDKSKMTR